jgi:Secretion system C-terminal sorting domain
MKHTLLSCTLLSLAFLALIPHARAQELVVHEWGTFTTVQGSNGVMLSGLYLEEEKLPKFVHHHEGFAPGPTDFSGKAFFGLVANVTVKMETPVLYFYSDRSMPVKVHVGFPRGSISQWYPQRSAGEKSPGLGDQLLFGRQYNGWIEWNGTVLEPGSTEPLTPNESQLTPTWIAPRATDANLIKSHNGEVEKYLFYRGIGNFKVPLLARFNAGGDLQIANNGADLIPFVMVYDKPEEGAPRVIWSGSLVPGEDREIVDNTEPSASGDIYFGDFIKALVSAGLYEKEAESMLNTWRASYFDTPGLRVFWIVPRGITDTLLPISVTPAPTAMERVLVGRSEVLRPEFEKRIYDDFAAKRDSIWKNDRYYLAYQARYMSMRASSVERELPGCNLGDQPERFTVYPNPTMSSFTADLYICNRERNATFTVTDLAGRHVTTEGAMHTQYLIGIAIHQHFTNKIDMTGLAAGIYFVTARSGSHQWTQAILKL